MINWHYNSNGAIKGPVSLEEIQALFGTGEITETTSVWTESYGSQWKRYGDVPEFRNPSTPPPLPVQDVNDTWAWLIVSVPVIAGIIELVITETATGPIAFMKLFALYIVPYAVLMALDLQAIKKSGRGDSTAGLSIWLILIPVYLFKRANRLGKSKKHFWAWILAFVAGLAITESNLIPSTGFHMGLGLPQCNSSVTQTMISDIFRDLDGNGGKIEVVDMTEIKEVSSSSTLRQCTAKILATDTETYSASYSIQDRDSGVYYELRLF